MAERGRFHRLVSAVMCSNRPAWIRVRTPLAHGSHEPLTLTPDERSGSAGQAGAAVGEAGAGEAGAGEAGAGEAGGRSGRAATALAGIQNCTVVPAPRAVRSRA